MPMRPEDLSKLTDELVAEMGPAGFMLLATQVYLRANAPEVCDSESCERLVGARAGELAMTAVMDEGQPNPLGRAITALSEYTLAVCRHPEVELVVPEEELVGATV